MDREFDRYTVRGLRNLARDGGLRRYSRLRRDELINTGQSILDRDIGTTSDPVLIPTTAPPLPSTSRQRPITPSSSVDDLLRYSRLRRDELINTGQSILDRDIGTTSDPVLIPTTAPPLPSTSRQRPITPSSSVDDLLRSLENVKDVPKSISHELNALKKKIKDIYSKVGQIVVEKDHSALKMWAEQYKIPGIPVSSPDEFLELSRPSIINILRSKRGTKVKMALQCYMYRYEEVDKPQEANFSSDVNEINLKGSDVDELYNIMVGRILENYAAFLRRGSGWAFHSVIHLKLHTVVYEPLRASGYIPLPDWISNKKACINMKNDDNECFDWAISRALNPKDNHPERIDCDLRSKKNVVIFVMKNLPIKIIK